MGLDLHSHGEKPPEWGKNGEENERKEIIPANLLPPQGQGKANTEFMCSSNKETKFPQSSSRAQAKQGPCRQEFQLNFRCSMAINKQFKDKLFLRNHQREIKRKNRPGISSGLWMGYLEPVFPRFFYPPSFFSLSFCAKLKISSHATLPVCAITPELPNSPPSILCCSFPGMQATIPRQKCAFLSLFFLAPRSIWNWTSWYFFPSGWKVLPKFHGICWDPALPNTQISGWGSLIQQRKNTWIYIYEYMLLYIFIDVFNTFTYS